MKILTNETENSIIEKKSKFITRIFRVNNEDDIKVILKDIKKNEKGAAHNCYAYRIMLNNQIIERKNDDGEPGGTAGAPMLGVLTGENLINVLVVTTRYFGGIKLGTGGLVNVYIKGIREIIKKCNLVDFEQYSVYKLTFPINQTGHIEYFINKYNIKVKNKIFNNEVCFNLELTEKQIELLKKLILNKDSRLEKL
ncbi:MAG: YigZ family protein [Spirochaetes bacterium]|nr:YigZ family protein [Spirochaetota bacterium]